METCRGKELSMEKCIGLEKGLEKIETPQSLACAACIDLAFERATKDSLTGLPNRYALTEKYETLVENGSPFAVMLVDIKKQKQVNDNLGHSRGDQVLISTAQFLTRATREEDLVTKKEVNNGFVARWGGDEYVVIADLTPRKGESLTSAERLQIMKARLEGEYPIDPAIMEVNQELGGDVIGLHINAAEHNGESLDEMIGLVDPKGAEVA